MKKIVVFLMALFMVVGFISCENPAGDEEEKVVAEEYRGVYKTQEYETSILQYAELVSGEDLPDIPTQETKAWTEGRTLYCLNPSTKEEMIFGLFDISTSDDRVLIPQQNGYTFVKSL
jgi:hypothetical protein